MKKLRNRLSVLLTVLLVFSFGACSDNDDNNSNNKTPTVELEYSDGAIGDIVLADGKTVTAEVYTTHTDTLNANNGPAIGVIAFLGDSMVAKNGTKYMVGLKKGTNLAWATSGTYGASNSLGLETTCTGTSIDTCTFSGNTDGSDDWEVICGVDSTGAANSAENYPAFNYAEIYATTAEITGTYASNWYLPSYPELCYIKRNREKINPTLTALSVDFSGFYMSSSEINNSIIYVCSVTSTETTMVNENTSKGGASEYKKVIVIRALN